MSSPSQLSLPVIEDEKRDAALRALNAAGVRLLPGMVIGVWKDYDERRVKMALKVLGLAGYPIKFLEDADVPDRYKVGRVAPEDKGTPWAEWKAQQFNAMFHGEPNIKPSTVAHGERTWCGST